ncbi:hypothetical protein [Clostridium sp.]|uniref:hypothetical protein n=1 Tax=Clostridium sp. TaxID=1506 RepID=UPI003464197F
MKNKLKILSIWILIALIAQFVGLFYANNYLFSSNISGMKVKKVNVDDEKKEEKKIEISVPKSAEDIKVSFDGKFLSYTENGNLKIINTNDGEEESIEFNEGSYYQWLNDRNRMILGEKDKGGVINLSYYDVDKNNKEEIKKINTKDSTSKVTEIKASTLTQVIYVKTTTSSSRSSVYRINIMKELSKVPMKSNRIGNIEVINRKDDFIYEDTTSKNVYLNSKGKTLGNPGEARLLKVDEEDVAYVANMEGTDVVKSISYGPYSEGNWKKVDIPKGTKYNDIYISNSGDMYVNDNLRGILKDVKNNKEISYSGRLLSLYEGGIATISDGKLVKTKIQP